MFDTRRRRRATSRFPPGFVAIAVQVDQVTGVGTVIKTGDYVDLVMGVTGDKFPVVIVPSRPNPGHGRSPASTPRDVKACSTACRSSGPPAPAATLAAQAWTPVASAGTTGGAQRALNGQQEIVVLAVSAQQAEVIKYAQLEGSISLVLRSTKDFHRRQRHRYHPR